jgi:hypothetical protein
MSEQIDDNGKSEDSKKVIQIDISGETGVGKSAIARVIKEALSNYAIEHDIRGEIENDNARVVGLHETIKVNVDQINIVKKHVYLNIGNAHMNDEETMKMLREDDFLVDEAHLTFRVNNVKTPTTVNLRVEASDHLRSVFAVHGHELYQVPYAGPGTMMRLVLDHKTGFIEQRIGEDCYYGLSTRWNLYIKLVRRYVE